MMISVEKFLVGRLCHRFDAVRAGRVFRPGDAKALMGILLLECFMS